MRKDKEGEAGETNVLRKANKATGTIKRVLILGGVHCQLERKKSTSGSLCHEKQRKKENVASLDGGGGGDGCGVGRGVTWPLLPGEGGRDLTGERLS